MGLISKTLFCFMSTIVDVAIEISGFDVQHPFILVSKTFVLMSITFDFSIETISYDVEHNSFYVEIV